MSSSAIIATVKRKSFNQSNDIGVYIHFNGDPDSVKAFLDYCKRCKFRSPEIDTYGWARLCQVIANFFGPDGLSVGIDKIKNLPYTDYGVYVIKNWEIVDHQPCGKLPTYDEARIQKMLIAIDSAQPKYQHY